LIIDYYLPFQNGRLLEVSVQSIYERHVGGNPKRIEAQVKWYDPKKGYGFLVSDKDPGDIFIHFAVLDAAGFQSLGEGDRLICDVVRGDRGLQALNVLEVKLNPDKTLSPLHHPHQWPLDHEIDNLKTIEGEIKWYNPAKEYGFITPHDGGRDIFLHASVLQNAGYNSLKPGVRVLAEVSVSDRGREAQAIRVLN
jgi:cold shock protein